MPWEDIQCSSNQSHWRPRKLQLRSVLVGSSEPEPPDEEQHLQSQPHHKYDVLHMIICWLGNSHLQSRLYLLHEDDDRTSIHAIHHSLESSFHVLFVHVNKFFKSCVKCLPCSRWCALLNSGALDSQFLQ